MMSPRVDIVRVVGRSWHGTASLASLYESGIRLRQTYLWTIDGCTINNYAESDSRSIHFFATTIPFGSSRSSTREEGCSKNDNNDSGNHATTNVTVVGTVQYDPETNRLRQLIVDPTSRNQRIGARLVDAVKEEALDRCQQQSLKVHAWLDSVPFYVRQGFRITGDVYESNGVLCQVMTFLPQKKRS